MKEKTFGVFDRWGNCVGTVSGISKADATKNARELFGEFPTLIRRDNDTNYMQKL